MKIRNALREGQWERSDLGIVLPRLGILLQGRFTWRGRSQHNLLTDEGIAMIAADTWPAVLYGALFADDVTPLSTWTGATFDADATEITSTSEGYVEANRPALPDLGGGDPMEFNLRTATTLTICGFGLLDGNTRGSTTDALIAAIRFDDAPAPFDDHDILDVRYSLTTVIL